MNRRPACTTVAGALMALALATTLTGCGGTAEAAASVVVADPVTATVEYGTLTSQLRLQGVLTYGDAVPLPPAPSIITALPAPGDLIGRGDEVFEVDGAPVVLFTGDRPFWRTLDTSSSRGADVLQLEENLAALGFLTEREPGNRFDARTRAALRRWQYDLGVPRTNYFDPASVVVAPSPSIRIEHVTARSGEVGVSPATFSETALHVNAVLTAAQAREIAVGTAVTATLRDGTVVDGVVSEVYSGGQPAVDGSLSQPSATITFAGGALPIGTTPGAVTVTVYDSEAVPETLIVPVTAILATADGAYAVEIWEPATRTTRVVPVEVGLVAEARAQILGGALSAGDEVVLAR